MKFNKVIMGLGVMGLLLTSCDAAEDQVYVPAEPVAAPPAYFSLDYDSEIILEEGQTSFSVPVYRSGDGAAETVAVSCTPSANVKGNFTIPESVTFAEGESQALLEVTYDWEFMQANPGVDFEFNFTVPGDNTPYYITAVDYTAVYVPWENVVGPQGGTTSYFLDDLFWSGWNGPETQKYEVTVQHIQGIAKYANIFRILTPYANCPHIGGQGQGIYEGPSTGNDMYLNAQDPDNVYLCNKTGSPITTYNTYYVMDSSYGQVYYWDCVSAYMLDETLSNNGKTYSASNSKGNTALCGVYSKDDNRIEFPKGHFYVYVPNTAFTTSGNTLTILLPDGKERKVWEEIGMCNYTDGAIAWASFGDTYVYEVPLLQNMEDPNLFRLLNPYTNYWPDGNDQDDDYPIDIDCTDPDLVSIKYQDTGITVYYRRNDLPADLLNAGFFYQNKILQDQEILSPEEIKAQGLNDTYADNVIEIKHPMLFLWTSEDKTNLYVLYLWEGDSASPGCQIVFPQASTQAPSYAAKATGNRGKYVPYKKANNANKKLTRKYDSATALPFAKVLK